MSLAAGSTALQRIQAYRRLIFLAFLILGFDQISKAWVGYLLPFGTYGESSGAITVVRGFFYIVHVGNTGAAWSVLSGRSLFLAALAAGTLLGIFLGRRALGLKADKTQICFGLLCGGIAGNLIDRIVRHHVVDFLDFHFGSYIYPTFNVADSGICIGVFLYLIFSMRTPQAS